MTRIYRARRTLWHVSRAIRLVAENPWQRVLWWLFVTPKLTIFTIAVMLGFYAEDFDDD